MFGTCAPTKQYIPYIHGVTEPIKRILFSYDVKVAQNPLLTVNHIFGKHKDPVPKEQESDAIYYILCNDCNQEHIEQTKRQFGTRLNSTKKQSPFQKRIIVLCRSTRAKQITRLRGILPRIDGTIKDVVWKLGI